jgi:hypothetical protein
MLHHTEHKTQHYRHSVDHNVDNIPHESPLGTDYGVDPVLKADVLLSPASFVINPNKSLHAYYHIEQTDDS